MDCKIFRSLVEPCLKNNATKKALSIDLERHLQSCAICQDRYDEPHVLTYGNPEINDKGFNDVYAESILARGGLKVWIEMRLGTSRIYIQYTS